MTRVGQPTSGFMSEAAVKPDSKLIAKQRRKENDWTSSPSAALALSLPSDIAVALRSGRALLAGARAYDRHECQHTQTRRRIAL